MAHTNRYEYATEQEAVDAVNSVNAYYGIPKSGDATAKSWTTYFYDNEKEVYYINYHESLKPVLNVPMLSE
jgi:hypothetical protein